jgi:cystathionine beta-lyase
MKKSNGFRTWAVHRGHFLAGHHGAVETPIYQTSTFTFRGANRPGPFDYSRSGNPTRNVLEQCLAELENGSAGFAFANGMAADATVLMMFSAGDRLIVQSDLYGGTYRLLETVFGDQGIAADFVDLRDLPVAEDLLRAGAKAI